MTLTHFVLVTWLRALIFSFPTHRQHSEINLLDISRLQEFKKSQAVSLIFCLASCYSFGL